MDPTSPKRQSQQPHFRQSSCQYKSKAFNKNRSVIRLQHPAHSRCPIPELLVFPLPFSPPSSVVCIVELLALPVVDDVVDVVDNVDAYAETLDGTEAAAAATTVLTDAAGVDNGESNDNDVEVMVTDGDCDNDCWVGDIVVVLSKATKLRINPWIGYCPEVSTYLYTVDILLILGVHEHLLGPYYQGQLLMMNDDDGGDVLLLHCW